MLATEPAALAGVQRYWEGRGVLVCVRGEAGSENTSISHSQSLGLEKASRSITSPPRPQVPHLCVP